MQDNLAIIDRVLREHQRLRGTIKLVGESTSDLEAVFSLQQVYSGWTLSSLEVLDEKQKQLHQTLDYLREGINKHFAFEEYTLPPIFGALLMQALRIEHQRIRKDIDEAESVIVDTKLVELDQEKLLQQKSRIQQMINNLAQTFEDHAAREEVILNMLKRALQTQAPDRG